MTKPAAPKPSSAQWSWYCRKCHRSALVIGVPSDRLAPKCPRCGTVADGGWVSCLMYSKPPEEVD